MSEEKQGARDEVRVHHVYDGIVEQDHQLPSWWLALLCGTILFACGYWGYYEVLRAAPGPLGEYRAAAELHRAVESAKPRPVFDDEALARLAKDDGALQAGKQVFATNCAACHGVDGQGIIGPNLTDSAWLHGGKPTAILKVVADGVTQKGMPAWGSALGEERVRNVSAFIVSRKGLNLPGGKAPQGEAE